MTWNVLMGTLNPTDLLFCADVVWVPIIVIWCHS